jgi:hypothetical protein
MIARLVRGRHTPLLVAAGLLIGALAAPSAAEARGFVSLGFGFPLVAGPPAYYYPPPPPAYYYPPPAYYPPPPAYSGYPASPPMASAAPAQPGGTCREYQTTTMIGGVPQRAYGTACLQPDGTWRIVR